MKKKLYLKSNLILFLNDRIYSLKMLFLTTVCFLKRDLFFFKIWTYTKEVFTLNNLFLDSFAGKYALL